MEVYYIVYTRYHKYHLPTVFQYYYTIPINIKLYIKRRMTDPVEGESFILHEELEIF